MMNISPAWFEQGHKVCSYFNIEIDWLLAQTEDHLLKILAHLKTGIVLEWLRKCSLSYALIGGILSVVQPELFESSQEAFRQLAVDPNASDDLQSLMEILATWYAPFSALAVISNWSTPLHCNTGGRPEWLDFILALGNYDHSQFAVPAFRYTFKYNPGMLIAFSGKIFQHRAECTGDWACIVFYMCDNVLNRLGICAGSWFQAIHKDNLHWEPDPVDPACRI